jgi:very-short-patch-repair endonuclease
MHAGWTIVVLNDKNLMLSSSALLDLSAHRMNNCRFKRQNLILSSSTLLDLGARRMNHCRFKRQNLMLSSSVLLDLNARRMNNCRFKRQHLMPSLVQSIIIYWACIHLGSFLTLSKKTWLIFWVNFK